MSALSLGVLIPTHRGERDLPRSLPPVLEARPDRTLVIDSSPDDATAACARDLGAEVHRVSPGSFNHGLTREQGRHLLGTDIVVMLTQDAVLREPGDLGRLAAPVLSGDVAAAYGRQLAPQDAGLLERYPREYSYPADGEVRSAADVERLGTRAFFFSNAFAAWSNAALDEVGGFPETLSHEDAITAARLLRSGRRIAYVADAAVWHSHRIGCVQELRRYFDAGAARGRYASDLAAPGGHGQDGRRYAEGLIRQAGPREIGPVALHLAARLAGFKLGGIAGRLPRGLNRRLSATPGYWTAEAPGV